ncbi:MAG: acetylornithine deacetylase [Paracoccaceae bacterium]|nr:acetylornithine deacetylase [Paracoccaceae bacterium]
MTDYLNKTEKILADLIAFPTITGTSNSELIKYVKEYLQKLEIEIALDPHLDGKRFNLIAIIGSKKKDTILLSAHTDVVPAQLEGWSSNPFKLKKTNGRLYGRGALDMKGFMALMLAFAPAFKFCENILQTSIVYALTFDEEEGTLGAVQMKDFLKRLNLKPKVAIVGEPTGMQPFNGHKGGLEMVTKIKGSSGHASDPIGKVNALYFAARLISFIETIGKELAQAPIKNCKFQPPYTTLSVGHIEGGEARNIIPNKCKFKWEIRPIADDDQLILQRIKDFVINDLHPEMHAIDETTGIEFIEIARCPSLKVKTPSVAASLIRRLWTNTEPSVLSFGTDGAHYQACGIDTIIFGPGDMRLMHQPNEYIEVSEIDSGISFMKNLLQFCKEN